VNNAADKCWQPYTRSGPPRSNRNSKWLQRGAQPHESVPTGAARATSCHPTKSCTKGHRNTSWPRLRPDTSCWRVARGALHIPTDTSFCSARTAPTRRITVWQVGHMPTPAVRRRISRLGRSCGLLAQNWRQFSLEKPALRHRLRPAGRPPRGSGERAAPSPAGAGPAPLAHPAGRR